MIKRTLYFGNPVYLSLENGQMLIRLPEACKNKELPESVRRSARTSVPVEDIGVVVLDHQQITITQALIAALLENNVAFIPCDQTHHPSGLLLPLNVNTVQNERFRIQMDASLPLKKQMWQQTVSAKIFNQAIVLKRKGREVENMMNWAASVRSGDPDNFEARAAAYYWKSIFPDHLQFFRRRDGEAPNQLLNYGYAVLRAIVARGLTASGLLPTLGIHHRNKYNAYCLADDIMEPYRPIVDEVVCKIVESGEDFSEITVPLKKQLLEIPGLDIVIGGEKSPLMVGIQRTSASIVRCFEGSSKKILYPIME